MKQSQVEKKAKSEKLPCLHVFSKYVVAKQTLVLPHHHKKSDVKLSLVYIISDLVGFIAF